MKTCGNGHDVLAGMSPVGAWLTRTSDDLQGRICHGVGPILVDAMAAAAGHQMTAPRNGGCQVLLQAGLVRAELLPEAPSSAEHHDLDILKTAWDPGRCLAHPCRPHIRSERCDVQPCRVLLASMSDGMTVRLWRWVS